MIDARKHYMSKDLSQLQRDRQYLEKHIEFQNDPTNECKMPWMIKSWNEGLKLMDEIIELKTKLINKNGG